ncbi:MAG: hypothetical protein O2816_00030 [Planctomycetota bacterium]|nr:hypothetical protein [Planctomycetota bacterium]
MDAPTTPPLELAWKAFAHQVAALAGATAAVVALWNDAPVTIACLRGALAWAAALLTARVLTSLLRHVTPDVEPVPNLVPEPGEGRPENDSTLKGSEAPGR